MTYEPCHTDEKVHTLWTLDKERCALFSALSDMRDIGASVSDDPKP